MKKEKLTLNNLKVQSFITKLDLSDTKTVKDDARIFTLSGFDWKK